MGAWTLLPLSSSAANFGKFHLLTRRDSTKLGGLSGRQVCTRFTQTSDTFYGLFFPFHKTDGQLVIYCGNFIRYRHFGGASRILSTKLPNLPFEKPIRLIGRTRPIFLIARKIETSRCPKYELQRCVPAINRSGRQARLWIYAR